MNALLTPLGLVQRDAHIGCVGWGTKTQALLASNLAVIIPVRSSAPILEVSTDHEHVSENS